MSTTAGSTHRPFVVLEARMAGVPWKLIAGDADISIGAASAYLTRAIAYVGSSDFPSAALAWRAHLSAASSELTETQRAAVAWSSESRRMKTSGVGNYPSPLPSRIVPSMSTSIAPNAGQALRALREARGLAAADVAREAGVSRQRVTTVEGLDRVTPYQVQRYRRAVSQADDARLQRIADTLRRGGG